MEPVMRITAEISMYPLQEIFVVKYLNADLPITTTPRIESSG